MMESRTTEPLDPNESYKKAKAFYNNGEFFRSCDLAVEGHAAWPQDTRFAHLAVLSLTNSGAVDLAIEKFEKFGLSRSTDQEARSLLGRLKKDQGFATRGEERLRFHREARQIYEEAYARALNEGLREAYYPGVNAAALALWTDDTGAARQLARAVLAEVELLMRTADGSDRYWLLATSLEAKLLLGEVEGAEALAAAVLARGAGHYAEVATTGRQLRRIAAKMGLAPAFLSGFVPPAVMHYTGHIIAAKTKPGRFPAHEEKQVEAEIRALLEAKGVGSGYGSLAAGADILFAEALLARGATLNVVLPFAVEDFLDQSVRSAGGNWEERFRACFRAAKTTRFATDDSFMEHESLFNYCSQLGMGLAVLAARHMHAPVLQVAVWDGEARSGAAGTAVDMKAWQDAKLQQYVIHCGTRDSVDSLTNFEPALPGPGGTREIRAMLFADVHGFSKLNDQQLPLFAEKIMGPLADAIEDYRPEISFLNTWGDGIFAVLADVGKAASLALKLQEAMHGIDLKAIGLPDHLTLRVGGHLGPAYELMDPMLKRMNYYGAHVSRAARIEPIVPQGSVYVTETFAAVLALRRGNDFACDYVGVTDMAKGYGQLRMFLLRPLRGSSSPAVLGDIERTPLPVEPADVHAHG